MEPSNDQRRWIEIGLFAGAAFLLYQIRAAFFLSAVPLFLLGYRRDKYAQLYGAGIFILAVFVETVLRIRGVDTPLPARYFVTIELAYPLSIVTGVIVVRWRSGRTLYRLLESVVLVGIITVPIILGYSRNTELSTFLAEQIRLITEAIRESFAESTGTGPAVTAMSGDEMVKLVRDLFFRNFLFSYFLLLSAVWALSRFIYARAVGQAPFLLDGFTVPETLLWPFIGAWAGVLLDVVANLGFVGYLFWNAGMILLFIYALQGIAILRSLFRRYGVGTGLRIMVVVASVVVLFTPGLNFVLVIGVPLLGVSEYWIHYRMGEGD